MAKKIWNTKKKSYLCNPNSKELFDNCENSSEVEHYLAKVGVAGSNPVFRSKFSRMPWWWNW